MKIQDTIVIAREFSSDPGAREENDGINSGARFYEELLQPKFKKALSGKYKLLIDLDGVYGYPSSFVSGSFGRLSTEYGVQKVMDHLEFKSDRRPIRIDKIKYEIMYPEKERI